MKVKTNYANTPAWREVNVKSRIPEPLKMLEGMMKRQRCLKNWIRNCGKLLVKIR